MHGVDKAVRSNPLSHRVIGILLYLICVLCVTSSSSSSCVFDSGFDSVFPSNLPTSCETLSVAPHQIVSLPAGLSAGIPDNVTTFIVEDGPLSSVHDTAFEGLFIEELRLGKNDLQTVPNLEVRVCNTDYKAARCWVMLEPQPYNCQIFS